MPVQHLRPHNRQKAINSITMSLTPITDMTKGCGSLIDCLTVHFLLVTRVVCIGTMFWNKQYLADATESTICEECVAHVHSDSQHQTPKTGQREREEYYPKCDLK